MGFDKDEDSVAVVVTNLAGILRAQKIAAGYICDQPLNIDDLSPEHVALVGQSAKRIPALMIWSETLTGEKLEQAYQLTHGALVDALSEILTTFGSREMWKFLSTVVPEEWTA